MQVIVKGKHFHVPDKVRAYADEKVGHTERIFPDTALHADVVISEEKNPRVRGHYVCEVTMAVVKGRTVRAHAAADDPQAAIDVVVDKLEIQLRKLKGRLVGRSHPHHRERRPETIDDGEADDYVADTIVRRKRFSGKPMTEEEAALQLDLLSHEFFLFSNAETGSAAVLYRRKDGDLGLIELD